MNKAFRYIICFSGVLLILSFKISGLQWKPITIEQTAIELKELQKVFAKKTSYSVKVKYNTYDSQASTSDIKDKSDGYIIKNGDNIKSRLLGIFTVQNNLYRVTIDSAKKIIQVSNTFKSEAPVFSLNDYSKILKFCKSVQTIKDDNKVAYRFETKNKEGVMAQEVFIENEIIIEANIYYANLHAWREDNTIKKKMVYPKLQVLFTNYNDKIKFSLSDFSTDNIIQLNNKKLVLTQNYKGFKLIDGRIKK